MGMIDTWIGAFTKPADTFKKESKNATIGKGAVNFLIGFFVYGLILGIIAMIGVGATMSAFGLGAGAGILVLLMCVIGYPIIGLICAFIGVGILHLVAGLFGGKGNYGTLFGYMGMYTAPLLIISGILMIIPIVGGLVSLLLGLYSLYLLTVAIRENYGLTTMKAVLVWIVPSIVVAILATLFVGAAVLAMLGGAGAYY